MYNISKKLISELKKNKISYCHWKSNFLLDKSLSGYDDLDLLIKKNHIAKFESILYNLDFKRASNRKLEIQSVHHFYGYDIDSGEILHLHIYYQIKTGPSWTKSLRFDLEDYILDNTIIHSSGMPIPKKYIEIVIFVIRIMIKYSKINEFILVNKESVRTNREIEYLLHGVDIKKIELFLNKFFPNISLESFYNYIKIIQQGSLLKKFVYSIILKKSISRYLYQGSVINSIKNTEQFFFRIFNKFFYRKKKNLFSGGSTVAIVGLDATGKSTITYDLKKWLGKNFTVSLVHFGKPPTTFITLPFNLIIKVLRKLTPLESEIRSSIKTDSEKKSFIFLIRQLILAYDRFILSKIIWRKSSNGNLVLCDRYKSEDFGVMDSKRLNPENYTGVKRKICLKENKLYDLIFTPDILFYLTVPVDVAVKRNKSRYKKGKESEMFLRKRHKENQNLNYNSKMFYKINTNRNYDLVIKEIKSLIWKNI